MKRSHVNLFRFLKVAIWIMAFGNISARPAYAGTFTTLHNFTLGSGGFAPDGRLVSSGTVLYGTAQSGVAGEYGVVFKLNRDGTGFTNLCIFPYSMAFQHSELVLSDNMLYGTADGGGSPSYGTVFALNTDGTGLRSLYSFSRTSGYPDYTNSDGAFPNDIALSEGVLYGTAVGGGNFTRGTVFALTTDGLGFTVLHTFVGDANEGAYPTGLMVRGNIIYGATGSGGAAGGGTIFKLNTDGTGFKTLHSCGNTRSDGAGPVMPLVLSSDTLYGAVNSGGSEGNGMLFALALDGTGFTNLHSFAFAEGQTPAAGLILAGDMLCGTAGYGGTNGNGTVFTVRTNGTDFTILHTFATENNRTNEDGERPSAPLLSVGNTLYGTTVLGGSFGYGTVFSLPSPAIVPPHLSATRLGGNLVLSWPTDADGFGLQSAPNLDPTATWATNSAEPVIFNGQNVITNPISGTQQFYRLAR